MMRRRRRCLIIRQPLDRYRMGRISQYDVGYWEGRSHDSDRDFRSFGSREFWDNAVALARDIARNRPGEFFYDER